MITRINGFVYYTSLLLFTLLFSGCFKSLTVTDVVYENNFEDNKPGPFQVSAWSNGLFGPVSDTRISNFGGGRMLGKMNNGLVMLNLSKLPPHQILRLEFDVYMHDDWRNDLWKYSVDGAEQLVSGFSNDPTVKQSYPNWLGSGSPGPAGRNAADIELAGACALSGSARGSSRYRIISTVPHTSENFSFIASDAGNFFNDTCKRSWALDNVKVSVFNN